MSTYCKQAADQRGSSPDENMHLSQSLRLSNFQEFRVTVSKSLQNSLELLHRNLDLKKVRACVERGVKLRIFDSRTSINVF